MRCTHPTIAALIVALTAMAFAEPARAQVAAPSMLPDEFVTPNPAAMQWDDGSRAGISYAQTTVDASSGDYDTATQRAGLLALWSWGGLAAELEHEEDTEGDVEREADIQRGALSLMPLNWLAVGGLAQNAEFSQSDLSGFTLDATSEIRALGGSVRLLDVIYLGYAQGQDSGEFDIAFGPSTPAEIDFADTRDVRAWGLALRGGKMWRYHLEYYSIEFDPFEFPSNVFFPEGVEIDEHRDSTAVVEIGWRSIVVGARLTEVDEESNKRDIHIQRYSVAWVPAGVLGLVYSYENSETEDQDTGDWIEDQQTHSLSLVYLF